VVTAALVIAIFRLLTEQPLEHVSFAVTHAEDAHPQYIRIFNLPDGPREIVFRRVSSWDDDASRPIRIFNSLSEGVQEIAVPQN
jgi:hypothetical protein